MMFVMMFVDLGVMLCVLCVFGVWWKCVVGGGGLMEVMVMKVCEVVWDVVCVLFVWFM